jgi:hypothetical protein
MELERWKLVGEVAGSAMRVGASLHMFRVSFEWLSLVFYQVGRNVSS